MNYLALQNSSRLVWTVQAIAETLNISRASARVLCSRYFKQGFFTRIRNNLYILSSHLKTLTPLDLFTISNLVQTPSYVSFMTALSHYGITTQILPNTIECVNPIRTIHYSANHFDYGFDFNYFKMKSSLYFGFERRDGFFIATPEKALLDCLYLESLGRYDLDRSSLTLTSLSRERLKQLSLKFPKRTRSALLTLLNDVGPA